MTWIIRWRFYLASFPGSFPSFFLTWKEIGVYCILNKLADIVVACPDYIWLLPKKVLSRISLACFYWLVDWWIDRWVEWSIGRSIHRLVNWWIDRWVEVWYGPVILLDHSTLPSSYSSKNFICTTVTFCSERGPIAFEYYLVTLLAWPTTAQEVELGVPDCFSLVPRPHPFTKKNSLEIQVESFLG